MNSPSHSRVTLALSFAVTSLWALALPASATEVTFRLVDQAGATIPVSRFNAGTGLVSEGQAVSLDPGSHTVLVHPGVNGMAQQSLLNRVETIVVAGASQDVTFVWSTAQLDLRIVDQDDVVISPSNVKFTDQGGIFGAGIYSLPVTEDPNGPAINGSWAGGYSVTVAPGIRGMSQFFQLQRNEPTRELTSSGDPNPIVWKTAVLDLRVVDQDGVVISPSNVKFTDQGGNFGAGIYSLPVTEDPSAPAIGGDWAGGYPFTVAPGIHGVSQLFQLSRVEPLRELTAAGDLNPIVWRTADKNLNVVDQDGIPITPSNAILASIGSFMGGGVVRLPVTDDPAAPAIGGEYAGGYPFTVAPGINGLSQLFDLYRIDPPSELTIAGELEPVVWFITSCPVQVLDTFGNAIVGSSIRGPYPSIVTVVGSTVRLPTTENAVYPTIGGQFANGYPLTVTPGDVAPNSGTFDFEMLASGAFSPALFAIVDRTYSMTCQLNRPPTADAGSNVTIISSQQSSTFIAGAAADPDNDGLTYVWRDGENNLLGAGVIGVGGQAQLSLGAVPTIALGTHVLTLEVSDGQLTASSSMQLNVGNSPPAASCAGAGTYQFGVDAIVLDAALADFDGDVIYYEWREGSAIYAAGTELVATGGDPTSLPSLTVTSGTGPSQLSLGVHELSLRYDDGANPPAYCQVLVQVVDSQAPKLKPTTCNLMLWPPNHQMVTVVIHANASDSSGGPVVLTASVTGSEDADKDGCGHTIPDVSTPVIDQNAGTITVQLRAERKGKGHGRSYRVKITATDMAGNQSTAVVVIRAPHDRRHEEED